MRIKKERGAGQVVQKTFTAKILSVGKAAPDQPGGETTGTFRAMVSAYGNTDLYGDVVEKGAFTRSLAEWTLKATPIPCVWSHQMTNLDMILGGYTEVEDTEKGLILQAELDLRHPPAARAHELMEKGIITEFSWSGEVREYELLDDDDEDSWFPAMKILDVDLWEAGPCFKGANPDTELISVKSDGRIEGLVREKAGRVISQKNLGRLKSAHEALGEVIASAETTEEEQPEPDTEESAPDPEAQKTAPEETSQQPWVAEDPIVRAALEQFDTTTEQGETE